METFYGADFGASEGGRWGGGEGGRAGTEREQAAKKRGWGWGGGGVGIDYVKPN